MPHSVPRLIRKVNLFIKKVMVNNLPGRKGSIGGEIVYTTVHTNTYTNLQGIEQDNHLKR